MKMGDSMKDVLKCIVIGIVIVGCFYFALSLSKNEYQESTIDNYNQQIVHITRSDGDIEQIPLETYLYGVVGCEMSPTYDLEALKAQSVAARTFVLSRNLIVDDTTASQVYMDEQQLKQRWKEDYDAYAQIIKEAVDATKGQYLTYNDQVISALFYAMSCGKTNNNHEYFNNEVPYLISVDSSYDMQYEDYEVSTTFSKKAVCEALKITNLDIQAIKRYESGYVESVMINQIRFSGRAIREALNLRSSAFTILINQNEVIITTYGYGHGVGMSQRGALAMAKQEKSYIEILNHYYPNTTLKTLE